MAGFQKGMVSMELDDEDKLDSPIAYPTASGEMVKPDFPCGLCIWLSEKELKKLGLDIKEAEVGGTLEFRAFARITATAENESENGYRCRAELQIEKMALEE